MSDVNALVIDDNHQNLRVLSQLLTRNHVKCVEVANPLKLNDVLGQMQRVDVVFLDLEMPGLDGFSVKNLLREQLGRVPIIAYTVHVSEIDVVRQHGFDGFLGKPLDSARFPQQLARILNREPVWERE